VERSGEYRPRETASEPPGATASAQPLPHNPRKQRKNPAAAGIGRTLSRRQVAEWKGFEPSRRFPVCTLSRGVPSTTRPPLRRPLYMADGSKTRLKTHAGRASRARRVRAAGQRATPAGSAIAAVSLRRQPMRGRAAAAPAAPILHRGVPVAPDGQISSTSTTPETDLIAPLIWGLAG